METYTWLGVATSGIRFGPDRRAVRTLSAYWAAATITFTATRPAPLAISLALRI